MWTGQERRKNDGFAFPIALSLSLSLSLSLCCRKAALIAFKPLITPVKLADKRRGKGKSKRGREGRKRGRSPVHLFVEYVFFLLNQFKRYTLCLYCRDGCSREWKLKQKQKNKQKRNLRCNNNIRVMNIHGVKTRVRVRIFCGRNSHLSFRFFSFIGAYLFSILS